MKRLTGTSFTRISWRMKIFASRSAGWVVVCAALLLTGRSQAQMLLSVTGISGEATNNLIAIDSMQWGLGVSIASGGGGGGVSAPSFSELTLTKRLDSASLPLLFSCADGQQKTTAVLTLKHPVSGVAYYTITLGKVYVTGFSQNSGGDRPTETITLHYETIKWVYQKVDSLGNPVVAASTNSWNLTTNSGS
ncbi:MAG: type VI secretion system tube protein Hcp [Verrucomicrobiota bacterium]